jgi:hypothetical protein
MVFNHPNIYSELSHARRLGRQLACRVVSPSLTEPAMRGYKRGDLMRAGGGDDIGGVIVILVPQAFGVACVAR